MANWTKAAAIALQLRKTVLHVTGVPGITKTEHWRQVVDSLGGICITKIPRLMDMTDFTGIPMPSDGRIVYSPTPWVHEVLEASKVFPFVVVLFDELTTASEQIQGMALRVIREKVVGDFQFPDNVIFAAASNPPALASGGIEQTAAFGNRMTHIQAEAPDARALALYWTEGKTGCEDLPRFTPEAFAAARPVAAQIVSRFILANPAAMLEDIENDSVRARWPLAYATPRTWEMVIDLVAACSAAGCSGDVEAMLVEGTVGVASTTAFLKFKMELDIPDYVEMLDGKATYQWDTKRNDRNYVVIIGLCNTATMDEKSKSYAKRWDSAMRILGEGIESGVSEDMLSVGAAILAGKRPKGHLLKPEIVKVAEKLRAIIKEAGIIK